MQQDEIQEWDEPSTQPEESRHQSSPNFEHQDLDRQYIAFSMELGQAISINGVWPRQKWRTIIDAASQPRIEQAMEALSKNIKESDSKKAILSKLEESCDKTRTDGTEFPSLLKWKICPAKKLECEVYSLDEEANDADSEGAKQEDDQHVSTRKTMSAPSSSQIVTTENSAMAIVNCGRLSSANAHDTGRYQKIFDVRYQKVFDARYHYHKENKCIRCASVKTKDKDCFFPLEFKATGKCREKCTNCKNAKQECKFANNNFANTLVAAKNSTNQSSGRKQPPLAAAVPLSPTPPPIPTAGSFVSTTSTAMAASAMTSSSPLVTLAAVSTIDPVSTMAKSKNGKRKAVSEPAPDSSLFKLRRTQDSSRVLHQVACFNNSFESFTDVRLRQMDSNRKRYEQEAAVKEHRLAYEESIQDVQEKRRIFKEKQRLYDENEPVFAATQEWLAVRSEAAGENLIEEANTLLSSIEQVPTLYGIDPALQHLRSVFNDFQRIQGELLEEHRFKGGRARLLYTLIERICRVVEKQVSEGGMNEESSGLLAAMKYDVAQVYLDSSSTMDMGGKGLITWYPSA